MGLKSTSLQALAKLGFTTPSEIQAKAIPALMAGDIDFIGQAQTGTGKTAAFLLPLMEKINSSAGHVQALVLAPTRELANQIEGEIVKFTAFEKLRSLSVYGGTPIFTQLKALKNNRPSIVVGTPGRVIDLIDRGALNLADVSYVVLDEADEMLDMGFFDDVQRIIAEAPNKKVWMFSATMPAPIKDLVAKHFHEPLVVKVTKQQLTTDAVEQTFLVARRDQMMEALCRYFDACDDIYGLVFTRTKIGAQELAEALNSRGYATEPLHGDMEQNARDFTMKRFKEKKCRLLTCTDVAARGIDVNDLTHVVNFGLPMDFDSYVHRIGRTGRGGSKGIALSIVEPMDARKIGQIERLTKAAIKRVELPTVDMIRGKVLDKAIKNLQGAASALEISAHPEYAEFAAKAETLSKDELLKALYAQGLGATMAKYRTARDIGVSAGPSSSGPMGRLAGRPPGPAGDKKRYFINVGHMDGVTPGDMVKFLTRYVGLRGGDIGRIDIREKFCFVDVAGLGQTQIFGVKGKTWGQRRLDVEEAQGAGGSGPGPSSHSGPSTGGFTPGGGPSAGGFQKKPYVKRPYAPRT